MDQESLVKDQIDAGQRFLGEFEKYSPVKFAGWLKETEGGRWYLYVISDSINDSDVNIAYGRVLQIVNAMEKPRLDPFRIRIVGANTSIAAQVMRLQQSLTTSTTPAPWHESSGRGIDDAYVYPIGISSH